MPNTMPSIHRAMKFDFLPARQRDNKLQPTALQNVIMPFRSKPAFSSSIGTRRLSATVYET